MHKAGGQASELLKSLSNPHRLIIFCQLLEGERSVGDLAGCFTLRSSTVSQHLALLRREGLVAARRKAQTIYYGAAGQPARRIPEALSELFCASPEGSGACAPKIDSPQGKKAMFGLSKAILYEFTPQDLQKALAAARIVLVDVREPNEHAALRITGTVKTPLSCFNPAGLPACPLLSDEP